MADRRSLAVAAGGSFLVYLVLFVLQPVLLISNHRLLALVPWTRPFLRMPPDLPEPWATLFVGLGRPAVATALWVGLVITLFVLYLGAARAVLAGARVSRRGVLAGFLLFAVVLVPALPIFSNDVFAYLAHGELVDAKRVSPYEVRMEDHRDLTVTPYAPRLRLGSVYGPLALRTFQWLHVAGADPFANMLIFKTFCVLLLLVSFDLGYRTLRALGRERREANALLLLFAWNPLVLVDGVLNSHVDVLVVFLFALGMFLLARGRVVVGLAVLAAPAAVKITFLFLAPVILVYAFRSGTEQGGARAGVARALAVAAIGAALNFVWLLPDWIGGSPLTALSELRGTASNSATFVLRRGIRLFGIRGEWIPLLTAAIFAAVVLFRIGEIRDRRALFARVSRDLLLAFLFFLAVAHPWYALAAFPVVFVAGVRRHTAALLVFSAFSLLGFYGARLAPGGHSKEVAFLKFFVGVLPAGVVFLAGDRILPAGLRARLAEISGGRSARSSGSA